MEGKIPRTTNIFENFGRLVGDTSYHDCYVTCNSNFVSFNVSFGRSSNNRTLLVMYNTGRVTLERYVNGEWKPITVLREADR